MVGKNFFGGLDTSLDFSKSILSSVISLSESYKRNFPFPIFFDRRDRLGASLIHPRTNLDVIPPPPHGGIRRIHRLGSINSKNGRILSWVPEPQKINKRRIFEAMEPRVGGS